MGQGSESGGEMTRLPARELGKTAVQQGSGRVSAHTVPTRVTTRVVTQGLSRRDLALLSFVGRFDQVTKKHIHSHVFKDNASETPCDRALKRLVKQRLLARIDIPTVGGAKGGSGQHVYQVGPAGWKDAFPGKPYKLATAVRYHTLDIASVFIDIDSHMDVIRYETEPESNFTIAHMTVEPDLFVEIDLGTSVRLARLEIDLGTERPRQLKDKLHRYAYALDNASNKQRRAWPLVIWVVPNEKRRAELRSLIAAEPAESQGMYKVCLYEDVVETLSS